MQPLKAILRAALPSLLLLMLTAHQTLAGDQSRCQEYGFRSGTEAFARCMQTEALARRETEALDRRERDQQFYERLQRQKAVRDQRLHDLRNRAPIFKA